MNEFLAWVVREPWSLYALILLVGVNFGWIMGGYTTRRRYGLVRKTRRQKRLAHLREVARREHHDEMKE